MHNHDTDTRTHGIHDDCPRCAQYVKNPTDLDAQNLTRIWGGNILTSSDMQVFNVLYRSVVIMQRLGEAVAWRDFDPARHSIATFMPADKPDQYRVFDHGGRS